MLRQRPRISFRFLQAPPRRWRHFMLFACIAGASTSLIVTADARPRSWGYYEDYSYQGAPPYSTDWRYRSGPRHQADRRKGRHKENPEKGAEPLEAAAQPKQPSGPMFFVVSIGNQHVSVYSNDGLLAREPISTGMPGHPTPMGIFNILGKERLHHSNIYSGAPMPFMQRITWSGVAMHEGVLPGYPASHGCIRLSHDFAQRMFGLTQGNERVIITRRDVAPVPFSHANLPVPALLPVPRAQTTTVSASILQNAVATSQDAAETIKASEDGTQPASAQQKLLNPADYAKAMKALAAKKAAEAAAAVTPARLAVLAKAKEMQIAAVSLKKAQIALNDASGKLQAADRQLQKTSGNGPMNAANAAKAEAEAKLTDAQAQVEAAERIKAEKDAEWASALKAYKDLDNVQKADADNVKIWSRRAAPVSVFISRKTQRLYIRQNFIRVFDVPITIRDPEKPIGTHLYMAMPPAKGTSADPAKLRWVVLTLPEGSADAAPPKRRRSPYYDDDEAPRAAAPATSASTALDRVEIPPEVGAKISEMLWAGGSIIVSDSGISRETDDYSDFIILTR